MKQIIDGDTTDYLYDAANRLETVNGVTVNFDANGNLLSNGVMTNTFDAVNRLIETQREGTTLQPVYDGVGNRVAQTKGATTTNFALDVGVGLPEVIYTSKGNTYLHLPGVIMAESAAGETQYLLSDGLGSIRQTVNETATVTTYFEFDPYGNAVNDSGGDPYGYTGEWWEDEVGLLHLRARWYLPADGVFLSRDPVESENPYSYVRGNPVNRVDPSGFFSSETIENSLKQPLNLAFQDRPGLYWLLRDADNGNLIDPLVVDFDANVSDIYPLRNSIKSTTATVKCDQNSGLIFDLHNRQGLTLGDYIEHLDDAAYQEPSGWLWRDKTIRLHYYRLFNQAGRSFYDDFDFDGVSELPDYIGNSAGVPVKLIVGLSTVSILDRYGNVYSVVSPNLGVSFTSYTRVEGYATAGRVPNQETMKRSLTEFGESIGGGVVLGLGTSVPFVNPLSNNWTTFDEYTIGLQAGGSVSITYGWLQDKDETRAWHWLDDAKEDHPSYVPSISKWDHLYDYPGNNCSCGSP